MDLYEIQQRAMFDEPVDYKGIKIYPITVKDYNFVKSASSAFSVNIAADTDLAFIGLPYMEYLLKKATVSEEYLSIWHIFNKILELSFREQIHSFKYDGDFLRLVVAVPTERYNDETMCVYKEKLSNYEKLSKDDISVLINDRQLRELKGEINILAEEMFTFHTFNDNDFDEIKSVICFLNDIDDTIIDPKWEAELKKADSILNKINRGEDSPQLEDLIDIVACQMQKLPSDIKDMTVRRFDRYLSLQLDKERYQICKLAEVNGTEFKKPVQHWLKAYKPKKRYAHAESSGGELQEILTK